MTAFENAITRSLDQLEDDIIGLSKRINASEYEFLVLLREFDLRQGWKAYHFTHCAEWLSMKCGIHPGTGREKVRVARALWDLPQMSAAFAGGELSYSKARCMTRLATPHNEQALLDYALPATAQQVEDHCRRLRNVQRNASTKDANRIHKQRYLSRTLHGDGSMTINVELTQEDGELVMKALELAVRQRQVEGSGYEDPVATPCDASCDTRLSGAGPASSIGTESRGEAPSATFFTKQADALVDMARAYLGGGSDKTTGTADHYQVMVHVDAAALIEDDCSDRKEAKSDLPIESVRRLCCDSAIVAVTEDEKGNPLNVGRKHRVVQPPLRRALQARDRTCRYPGCTHEKWLDAHHVMHWVDGGETSLENTMLLCAKHHRLLHEGGFSIKKNYKGAWYFETSQGKVISDAPVYQFPADEIGFEGPSEHFTEIRERAVAYDIWSEGNLLVAAGLKDYCDPVRMNAS